jgi:aryl-alcohol dehydrogenase-like predicted oxidoreductase
LIGPRTLDELDDSLRALDISLSKDDLEWLDGVTPALDLA